MILDYLILGTSADCSFFYKYVMAILLAVFKHIILYQVKTSANSCNSFKKIQVLFKAGPHTRCWKAFRMLPASSFIPTKEVIQCNKLIPEWSKSNQPQQPFQPNTNQANVPRSRAIHRSLLGLSFERSYLMTDQKPHVCKFHEIHSKSEASNRFRFISADFWVEIANSNEIHSHLWHEGGNIE